MCSAAAIAAGLVPGPVRLVLEGPLLRGHYEDSGRENLMRARLKGVEGAGEFWWSWDARAPGGCGSSSTCLLLHATLPETPGGPRKHTL